MMGKEKLLRRRKPMDNNINGASIVSLVLGIASFLIFPLILGILAVIFGLISGQKGIAVAGAIMGVISIIWFLFTLNSL
jgi:uncharacterized membrane protein